MLSGEWAIDEGPASPSGATTLVGRVMDQAALIGVLAQIYYLGLPLLSIEHLAPRGDRLAIEPLYTVDTLCVQTKGGKTAKSTE
jgi:hypothetical protein